MEPFMPDTEKKAFYKYLKQGTCYYEFGSGGSTVVACNSNNILSVVSAESDTTFYEKMCTHFSPKPAKLAFRFIDVGCKGNWGYPSPSCPRSTYERYYKSIDGNPDLVLIDGRFRVACALYTWFAVDGAAIVLFDDFFDRPFYHVVLEYYNVLEKAGRLAVLQKKLVEPPPDIIEKYSTDPR